MRQVDVDAYIVAGITDHITPWKACYETARIYGKKSEFILANAGHLQSLLNPPGAAKSFFYAAKVAGPDPTPGPRAQRATKAAGGRTGWPGCSSAPVRWSRRRRSSAAASTRRVSRRPAST
jgi:hypothetical protein